MKTKQLTTLISLIFCIYSCNVDSDIRFKNSIYLKSKVLSIKENLGDPISISCNDSIIVLGNYMREPLVQYYNDDGSFIRRGILKGISKDKMMVAGNIQYDVKSKKFHVNDFLTNRVFIFNNNSLTPEREIEASFFKSTSKQDFDKCLIGNDFFVAESRDPKGKLILFDIFGNKTGTFLKFPDKNLINAQVTEKTNAILYSVVFALSPDKNKIVTATTGAGIIEVANINSKSINSEWKITEFLPSDIGLLPVGKEVLPIRGGDSRMGYLGVSTTSNYIFTLFSGKTLSDKTCNLGKTIRVFDWASNAICEIHLDRFLRSFVISEKKNKIYGISDELNGKYEIVEYSIPNFQKM